MRYGGPPANQRRASTDQLLTGMREGAFDVLGREDSEDVAAVFDNEVLTCRGRLHRAYQIFAAELGREDEARFEGPSDRGNRDPGSAMLGCCRRRRFVDEA